MARIDENAESRKTDEFSISDKLDDRIAFIAFGSIRKSFVAQWARWKKDGTRLNEWMMRGKLCSNSIFVGCFFFFWRGRRSDCGVGGESGWRRDDGKCLHDSPNCPSHCYWLIIDSYHVIACRSGSGALYCVLNIETFAQIAKTHHSIMMAKEKLNANGTRMKNRNKRTKLNKQSSEEAVEQK